MPDQILYTGIGDNPFKGLVGLPEEPIKETYLIEYDYAIQLWEQQVESLKANAPDIVNIEVLGFRFVSNPGYWIYVGPDPIKNETIIKPGDIFDLPSGYEFRKGGYCEGCTRAGMWHCAHADTCGNAIDVIRIVKTEPSYINTEIKKVSEEDLKSALSEVKRKNKEIRDSYRHPSEIDLVKTEVKEEHRVTGPWDCQDEETLKAFYGECETLTEGKLEELWIEFQWGMSAPKEAEASMEIGFKEAIKWYVKKVSQPEPEESQRELLGLLEMLKSDRQQAIEQQEQEQDEEFNHGREEALDYAIELINNIIQRKK